MKNSNNLSRDQSLNSAQNANFGFRDPKDAVQWNVDVAINSVTNVVEVIALMETARRN